MRLVNCNGIQTMSHMLSCLLHLFDLWNLSNCFYYSPFSWLCLFFSFDAQCVCILLWKIISICLFLTGNSPTFYLDNTSIAMFSPVAKTLKSRYGDKQMDDSLAALLARQKARRDAHSADTERRKEDNQFRLQIHNQNFQNTDYSVLPHLQEKHFMERERTNRTITVDPAAVGIGTRRKTSPVRKRLPVLKASRKHLPGTQYSVARSKKARQKRRLNDSRSRAERKLYGSTIARSKRLYDNEERGWTVAGKDKIRRDRLALRKLRRESATMIQKHYR